MVSHKSDHIYLLAVLLVIITTDYKLSGHTSEVYFRG